MPEIIPRDIFNINDESALEALALRVFRYQSQQVPVYKDFIGHLGISPENINSIYDIPFLPVEFFKNTTVLDRELQTGMPVFTSSGTTGTQQSKHYIADIKIYEESFLKTFRKFYGRPDDYIIIALLPSYLEREGSSLIYMCRHLIEQSYEERSGFYLNEFDTIQKIIRESNKKVLLIGVTYALLDFAEALPFPMHNTIVMETGGMKGKRKELLRPEVHQILKSAFRLEHIHSEYGMTELLSQAYSRGEGIFECPPWMKIMIREINDPFSYTNTRTGGINIIDLANIHSCSFIATQDLGRKLNGNQFEVLGRFDNSDIRGCNLLVG